MLQEVMENAEKRAHAFLTAKGNFHKLNKMYFDKRSTKIYVFSFYLRETSIL